MTTQALRTALHEGAQGVLRDAPDATCHAVPDAALNAAFRATSNATPHAGPRGAVDDGRGSASGAMQRLLERNLRAHRQLFAELDALAPQICAAAVVLTDTLARGGRLFLFGNGGSASDSLHLAAEFTGRLRQERRPLAALALNADVAALTAIANDYGYAEVFARQLSALARPGDCAVAISTSGNSPNVLKALQVARTLGASSVALLGRDGGAARALADHAVVVPHEDSGRIQEAHIFIGHTWCGQVEAALGLVG